MQLFQEIEFLKGELKIKQLNSENLEDQLKKTIVVFEEIKKEKDNLENEIIKTKEEGQSELISWKNLLEKERNSNDKLELEKKKLQEVLNLSSFNKLKFIGF
jgi:hypothetical protein